KYNIPYLHFGRISVFLLGSTFIHLLPPCQISCTFRGTSDLIRTAGTSFSCFRFLQERSTVPFSPKGYVFIPNSSVRRISQTKMLRDTSGLRPKIYSINTAIGVSAVQPTK